MEKDPRVVRHLTWTHTKTEVQTIRENVTICLVAVHTVRHNYVHVVEQIAVCNLASIALNRYVTADKKFDFKQLEYVTSVLVKNLNKIIDVNYYPVPEVTICVLFPGGV